jgi:predicted transcriptional regulator YdeE
MKAAMTLLAVMLFSILMTAQINHPAKLATVAPFSVIGISCRTDNAREVKGEGCIGKQWGRLFAESLLAKIPGRADRNIIAVYTDYSGDKDGEYTFTLGAKVHGDTSAPEGMAKIVVPAGKYAVFTSERGPSQQVVPATWKRIWETPKSEPGGDRAYKTDFELYDHRATDPKNAVVDIYIGVG